MKVKKQKFGVLSNGSIVHLYSLSNSKMKVVCCDLGCTLTSILIKNANGTYKDILLGYSTLDGYINGHGSFGAVVGRFANRIGKAGFTLNGKKYSLDKNDGTNTLHGGFDRYEKKIWKAKVIEEKNYCGVKFSRTSPDGEQGFPGNVDFTVTYTLDESCNLCCTYTGKTDAATPVNLTNHAYFNLAGKGSVENHILQINSDKIVEVNSKLIPTGKLISVENTPFDFRTAKKIGKDIEATGIGYDHCYVTENYSEENKLCGITTSTDDLVEAAVVTEPESKLEMTVFTNQEGMQFYTGNYLKGITGKNGTAYENHQAFCLETQIFPDSPNKKQFPSCILEAEQTYKARTIFSFKI